MNKTIKIIGWLISFGIILFGIFDLIDQMKAGGDIEWVIIIVIFGIGIGMPIIITIIIPDDEDQNETENSDLDSEESLED